MVPRKNRSAVHLFALLLSQGKFENGCYVDALTYRGRVITGDAGCSGINCRKDGEEPRPSSTHIQLDIGGFMEHNLGLSNGRQWALVTAFAGAIVAVAVLTIVQVFDCAKFDNTSMCSFLFITYMIGGIVGWGTRRNGGIGGWGTQRIRNLQETDSTL